MADVKRETPVPAGPAADPSKPFVPSGTLPAAKYTAVPGGGGGAGIYENLTPEQKLAAASYNPETPIIENAQGPAIDALIRMREAEHALQQMPIAGSLLAATSGALPGLVPTLAAAIMSGGGQDKNAAAETLRLFGVSQDMYSGSHLVGSLLTPGVGKGLMTSLIAKGGLSHVAAGAIAYGAEAALLGYSNALDQHVIKEEMLPTDPRFDVEHLLSEGLGQALLMAPLGAAGGAIIGKMEARAANKAMANLAQTGGLQPGIQTVLDNGLGVQRATTAALADNTLEGALSRDRAAFGHLADYASPQGMHERAVKNAIDDVAHLRRDPLSKEVAKTVEESVAKTSQEFSEKMQKVVDHAIDMQKELPAVRGDLFKDMAAQFDPYIQNEVLGARTALTPQSIKGMRAMGEGGVAKAMTNAKNVLANVGGAEGLHRAATILEDAYEALPIEKQLFKEMQGVKSLADGMRSALSDPTALGKLGDRYSAIADAEKGLIGAMDRAGFVRDGKVLGTSIEQALKNPTGPQGIEFFKQMKSLTESMDKHATASMGPTGGLGKATTPMSYMRGSGAAGMAVARDLEKAVPQYLERNYTAGIVERAMKPGSVTGAQAGGSLLGAMSSNAFGYGLHAAGAAAGLGPTGVLGAIPFLAAPLKKAVGTHILLDNPVMAAAAMRNVAARFAYGAENVSAIAKAVATGGQMPTIASKGTIGPGVQNLVRNITPQGLTAAFDKLSKVMPDRALGTTVASMQALNYLQSIAPKPRMDPNVSPLAYPRDKNGNLPDSYYDKTDLRKFRSQVGAATDPYGALAKWGQGKMTPWEAETMQRLYPNMVQKIVRETVMHATAEGKPIPYNLAEKLTTISGPMGSGVSFSPYLTPAFITTVQGAYAKMSQNASGEAPTPGGGSSQAMAPTSATSRMNAKPVQPGLSAPADAIGYRMSNHGGR